MRVHIGATWGNWGKLGIPRAIWGCLRLFEATRSYLGLLDDGRAFKTIRGCLDRCLGWTGLVRVGPGWWAVLATF